jgi:hypothetical protein
MNQDAGASTDGDRNAQRGAGATPVNIPLTRRQWFLTTRYWLLLKNVIGWALILLSFVVGPLVPGPGGIPLFLIGFALISFPGKRRLTARVLRGRAVTFPPVRFALICTLMSMAGSALILIAARDRPKWLAKYRASAFERGPLAIAALYVIVTGIIWVIIRLTPHAANLMLRLVSKGRTKFRPWLRHHGIRLLPPRWRERHAHEPGTGPFRLKDEILKFARKHRRH